MSMMEIKYTKNIVKLSNQIHRMFFAHSGDNGAQECILHFILENYPQREICQKDVQHELGTRPSTVASTLKRLEQQGLIVRERVCGDERKKRIFPTKAALEKKAKIQQELETVELGLLLGISQKELSTFEIVVEKMIRNCQSALENCDKEGL